MPVILAWVSANWGYIATFFWVISEVLNQVPSIRSNTVLDFIINALDSLFAKQATVPQAPTVPPPPAFTLLKDFKK